MTRTALPANFVDFENQERAKLLSVIDKFRELGLGEDISLPQLVVVGDQSSGKSSLLEGLTGLAFPVASDLCTRSATQIVLRRATTESRSIRVSIIPGPESKADENTRKKLDNFARDIEAEGGFDFHDVLRKAAECMGLPTPDAANLEDLTKRFSDDVLKIELSGPDHPHLSVVDVPGLFHNPTKYQTKEDAIIIRQLIETYITDKRTIILAVMDGRNNLANQEVFRMARAADQLGSRTVGIITKLDALQDGEKNGVFKIASNEVENLHHGWFVVKNRSPQEIAEGVTVEERHSRETAFFRTPPWNRLPVSRKGVLFLKEYLGKLLYDHIRAEFPGLVEEIRKLHKTSDTELETLGQKRNTTLDQRRYLTRLATEYQATLEKVLIGIYPEHLKQDHPLKLRMQLHQKNEAFGALMTKNGHTMAFKTAKDEIDPEYSVKQSIFRRHSPAECSNDTDDIYEWIRQLYRGGRGLELSGMVNMFLIAPSFRQQTQKWHNLANNHIEATYKVVKEANRELLMSSISDPFVRERIEKRLLDSLNETFERAKERLKVIVDDERVGIPQTVNHYFAETLSKIRSDREAERLAKTRGEIQSRNERNTYTQVYDTSQMDLLQSKAAVRVSNEDQAVYDIHDILKSYYKVALKRFVDNVAVQIVERIFITEGPLKIFNPEYVATLADTELNAIAAEDFSVGMRRKELETKLERLEDAMEIARMLA